MIVDTHAGPVAAVAARPSQILSGSYDGDVILWAFDEAARSLVPKRRWSLHRKGINAVAWSSSGDDRGGPRTFTRHAELLDFAAVGLTTRDYR